MLKVIQNKFQLKSYFMKKQKIFKIYSIMRSNENLGWVGVAKSKPFDTNDICHIIEHVCFKQGVPALRYLLRE
jgi:hypothetical protein